MHDECSCVSSLVDCELVAAKALAFAHLKGVWLLLHPYLSMRNCHVQSRAVPLAFVHAYAGADPNVHPCPAVWCCL
jgi:hypothetical protein